MMSAPVAVVVVGPTNCKVGRVLLDNSSRGGLVCLGFCVVVLCAILMIDLIGLLLSVLKGLEPFLKCFLENGMCYQLYFLC